MSFDFDDIADDWMGTVVYAYDERYEILEGLFGPNGIALRYLAERGMVVLGPDGEPLDVRPLLAMARSWSKFAGLADMAPGSWLVREGLPADLADACLAADEVEP